MEENTQQSIKISQKVIKEVSEPSKKMPSNKFILNKQNNIPLSKSPKNINNIYDDIDGNQQINRTKRISQKQIRKQPIIKALDRGQPRSSQNNIRTGTNKKITFEYWSQLNKQIQKPKTKKKQKQVESEKQDENQNKKRNSIQVEKHHEMKKVQGQQDKNEIIQIKQQNNNKQKDKNKQVSINKEQKQAQNQNKMMESKKSYKKSLSKNKNEPKNSPQVGQSIPHSVKFATQKQKQEDKASQKSNKSIDCENKNEQVNENIESWSRKTCQTFRSTHSSCQDYLNHVFNYYCKINYAFGKGVTFDQIQEKMRIMTITNFMIFCQDFKIRQKIQRDKLVQIFKKNSTYHKHLVPQQFRTAVQKIADIVFKSLPHEKRFGKMLLFLQIHNSFAFVRKMNKLGVSLRFKNKRGIDVNIMPKYTFKLTPNNGKSQMQIQTQVKERQQLRDLLKQQHIQWHKNNRKNKVEELYNNAMKNKGKSKTNPIINLNKQNTATSSPINVKNSYYNPCQFLSQRKDNNSYFQIQKMKKMEKVNCSNSRLSKLGSSDRMSKQLSEYSTINSIYRQREMNLHKIISQAKNSIVEQNNCHNLMGNSILSQVANNNSIKKQYGVIKKQNQSIKFNNQQFRAIVPQTQNQQPFNVAKIVKNGMQPRVSKQLTLAQMKVQYEIRDINPSLMRSQVKSKKHLRATAKIDKDNQKQMDDLQQMIGAFQQEEDQFLEKHFTLQSAYEQNLSRIKSRIK